jgi:predicted anti-sigma-YlaC factor YlaD
MMMTAMVMLVRVLLVSMSMGMIGLLTKLVPVGSSFQDRVQDMLM